MRPALCAALALAAALSPSARGADDLLTIYRAVMTQAPAHLAAQASLEAEAQRLAQARSARLPSLDLTASRARHGAERQITPLTGSPTSEHLAYGSAAYSLNARLPLYRPAQHAQVEIARAQTHSAAAELRQARQDLAARTVAAYCDALSAREESALIAAQRQTVEEQLAAARAAQKAGYGTRIDVDEATAQLDLLTVQALEQAERQDEALRTLHTLMGRAPEALAPLRATGADSPPPADENLEHWLARAEAANPLLAKLAHQLDAQEQEAARARAAHLPTLDLVAALGHSNNDNVANQGSYRALDSRSHSIGVQLTLPLYAGGGPAARQDEVAARTQALRHQHEDVRRQIRQQVSREWASLGQFAARIRALRQAEHSAAQLALAARKGVEGGLRTTWDVLQAEQQRYRLRRDRALARHDWIAARSRLLAAADALDDTEISRMNGWFGEP